MKFKICIILLFCNSLLQASDLSSSHHDNNIDGEIFAKQSEVEAVNKRLILAKMSQELSYKNDLVFCAEQLARPDLKRAEFKKVRKVIKRIKVYMPNGGEISEISKTIDAQHECKFSNPRGYVSQELLDHEIGVMSIAVFQAVSANQELTTRESVTFGSAPLMATVTATAVNCDNNKNNENVI